MELILWRHADAEDAGGKDDGARELTKKGRRQAEKMAKWLRPLIEAGGWKILVSPAERALQTVKPLGLRFDIEEGVGTGAGARDLLRAAGWPAAGNVVVVGHQPTLGEVAAHLLGGGEGEVAIRKGAVWWFVARDRDGATETVLKAVVNPDLLGD